MKDILDFKFMKQDVEKEIKEKKLESIHYVLFDENKRLPWAFHLFYKDSMTQWEPPHENLPITQREIENIINTAKKMESNQTIQLDFV